MAGLIAGADIMFGGRTPHPYHTRPGMVSRGNLGLARIHRHEGHANRPATLPGPVPGTPFGTSVLEIATVARACQSGEFCVQPLV
jgi:hypothetical protein